MLSDRTAKDVVSMEPFISIVGSQFEVHVIDLLPQGKKIIKS